MTREELVKILRWPEDKRTCRVPWFVILRRLTFLPITFIGVLIATLGFFLMYGWEKAIDFFRENT